MPSQEWCKTGTVCRRYTCTVSREITPVKKNNDCVRAICLYSCLYIMVLFCNSRMYLWEIPLCYIEPSVNLWYTLCLLYKIFIEDQFKIYFSLFCNKSNLKDLGLFFDDLRLICINGIDGIHQLWKRKSYKFRFYN